ncbi:nucleic acid-binding protein [Halovenus sp. WSH3]|uniref:Nucleic acid-binding protein n=1 Tax=Halovenus carboxidivorans TaxID=2692199 RepID=A0A6B0TDD3_9EURY|nr:OB-fold domain-containing protein [Halovenus carboxidivorans]MXR51209.1 nucleic acid-binding protein [Halovenus carboxidivorans]
MSDARDEGYDDFLDAVEDDEPYYLEGPDGDGSLPPKRIDPATGSQELTEQPLPETGEIETYTQTHVAAPDFADDAPFVVAVADFGPVSVTGQIRGMEPSDVEIGQEVQIGVDRTETTDERILVFEPV